MLTDPVEAGRRVRAARAYANLSRQEVADRCGLSLKQVRDLEEGTRTVTTLAELDTIAQACDTPREFLRLGWTGGGELFEKIWQLLALVPDIDLDQLRALRNEAVHRPQPRHARSVPPRDGVAVRPGPGAAAGPGGATSRKTRG